MVDMMNAVAQMIREIGYEPFIMDYELFGTKYKFIRTDPHGVLINVTDGVIEVGVCLLVLDYTYGGGTKLDIADPGFTEEKLRDVLNKYIR